jgi:regulator of protease activity HflC (stomatin/prohibitin superfamily)
MEEKILSTRKNGMIVLLGCILLELLALAGLIIGIQTSIPVMVAALVLMCIVWIPLAGLRVLKPEEALVVTLFGNYTGTLKGPGFYAINPFSVSVNPAKKTRLGQSGDVDGGAKNKSLASLISSNQQETAYISNVISLKIMTLNNSRQKVNDVLGNPVEIGVAVMWRVVDTAKAVFTVDNYKEYLSLQCDTAVRNIVKIYP